MCEQSTPNYQEDELSGLTPLVAPSVSAPLSAQPQLNVLPDSSKITMRQPPSTPSFHLLAELAKVALIQGQFDRTRTVAECLDRFAGEFENAPAKALALAFRGMLAVVAETDCAGSQPLFVESRGLAFLPQSEALILRGLVLIACVQFQYQSATQYFASALQLNSGGFDTVDILLAALLEMPRWPEQAVRYLSLSWHYAMPDGGWLTHSPFFRLAAQQLQERCGVDCYRQDWLTGQHLSLPGTLQVIVARYTG